MNARRDMLLQRTASREAPSSGDFLSGVVGGVFILGVVLVGLMIGTGRSA